MKKYLMLSFVVMSTFTLTGCLEEILASLCKKLASNNSIIAVFETSTNYSEQFALLTYTNISAMPQPETFTVSDCGRNSFAFPNGERKVNAGVSIPNISFVNILDDVGNAFFFNSNGTPKTDQFSLSISLYASCADLDSNTNPVTSSNSASALTWTSAISLPAEDIPLIGECEITGQSAAVVVQDI